MTGRGFQIHGLNEAGRFCGGCIFVEMNSSNELGVSPGPHPRSILGDGLRLTRGPAHIARGGHIHRS